MKVTLNKKVLPVLLAASLVPTIAFAGTFRIKDVKIDGLNGMSASSVYSALPFRIGQVYDDNMSTLAIQRIYKMGVFDDVKVTGQKGVVYIKVVERPTISAITYKGFKTIKQEAVSGAIANLGLAVGKPLNKGVLDKAKKQIYQQAVVQGLYGADIDAVLTPLPNHRIGINFVLKEGTSARIRKIQLMGNKKFSSFFLKREMQQTGPGLWTWYTGTNKYQQTKMADDVKVLKRYYLDRGYLDASVETPVVSITPNRRDIDVKIQIQEGHKYKVSKVRLLGDFLGQGDAFKKLIKVSKGDVAKLNKIEADVARITQRLGELGYAMADVGYQFNKNSEDQTVEIVYTMNPAQRTYVRRIEIVGNERTRDEVIRREIKQDEGAWYSARDIELARSRIGRLGYFKDVQIRRVPVPGSPNQVDLVVEVTEQRTGLINLSLGYSSASKFTAGLQVKQSNVFGTGTDVSLKLSGSKYDRQVEFSHVDPYWTDAGISRAISVYYNKSFEKSGENLPKNKRPYRRNMGLGGYFTVPVARDHRIAFGVNFDRHEMKNFGDMKPGSYWDRYLKKEYGYGSTVNVLSLTAGWSYDTRDSLKVPTKGFFFQIRPQLTVGSFNTIGIYAKAQYHVTAWDMITLSLNSTAEYNTVLSKNKDYPMIKRLSGGGIGSVRGFLAGSLGPVDPVTGMSVGGSQRYFANAELYFPVPGMRKNKSLRWFVFADAGSVSSSKQECAIRRTKEGGLENMGNEKLQNGPCGWKFSSGLGVSWDSPLGTVIQLSYGFPLNAKPGDQVEKFQFQLNSSF